MHWQERQRRCRVGPESPNLYGSPLWTHFVCGHELGFDTEKAHRSKLFRLLETTDSLPTVTSMARTQTMLAESRIGKQIVPTSHLTQVAMRTELCETVATARDSMPGADFTMSTIQLQIREERKSLYTCRTQSHVTESKILGLRLRICWPRNVS